MNSVIKNLTNYKEILASMNLPDANSLDNLGIGIAKIHDLKIPTPFNPPTFRPDYYTIMVIKKGEGTFSVGNETFKLKSSQVLITYPENYTTCHFTNLDKVYTIYLTKKFIENYSPEGLKHISPNESRNGIHLKFSRFEINQIEEICLELNKTFLQSSFVKEELTINLITNFLLIIQNNRSSIKEILFKNNYKELVSNFHRNIEQNITNLALQKHSKLMRSKEHAALLNLSSNYFSKLISATTGKTANQWINEKLVEEIKYLLKNSDKPLAEIATIFGFQEVSYFKHFLKKHTKSSYKFINNHHRTTL